MNLPASITLTDSNYWLDGGSTTLHATTDAGEKIEIRLSQRCLPGSSNPGRLFVNQKLIAVRSNEEAQIISLHKNAITGASEESPPPPRKNQLILGDDIKQFMSSSPAANLERFRNEFVVYLESDEYIRIAEHGIPQR